MSCKNNGLLFTTPDIYSFYVQFALVTN